jgi:hypothetical protein
MSLLNGEGLIIEALKRTFYSIHEFFGTVGLVFLVSPLLLSWALCPILDPRLIKWIGLSFPQALALLMGFAFTVLFFMRKESKVEGTLLRIGYGIGNGVFIGGLLFIFIEAACIGGHKIYSFFE